MRRITFSTLSLLITALFLLQATPSQGADDGSRSFSPGVDSVVVYPDRALVIRKGRVSLTEGATVLRYVTTLPALESESVTAWSDDPEVVVRNVRTLSEKRSSSGNPQVRSLEVQIETVEREIDSNNRQVERLNLDLSQVKKLRSYLESYIEKEATSRGSSSALWDQTLTFLSKRSSTTRESLQKSDQRSAELQEKLKILNNKLNVLKSSVEKSVQIIEISIVSPRGGDATVGFSYITRQASWSVSYGARHLNDGSIEIDYYGNIQQESGEDWNNAKLQLSTSAPALGAERPRINSSYLSLISREVRRGFAIREEDSAASGVADGEGAVPESEIPAEEPSTGGYSTLEESGISLVFSIERRSDILSGKRSRKVTIANFKEKSEGISLLTVPSKKQGVYIAADLVNRRTFPLLAGPVDIYRSSGYIGRAMLERVPPGSKYRIGLGVEPGVAVRRIVNRKRGDGGMLGPAKRFEYSVEIRLKNGGDKKRSISVYESIPVSDVEEVRISLQEGTTPGYTEEKKGNGVLKWELEMGAGEEKRIQIFYRVDAPSDFPERLLPEES